MKPRVKFFNIIRNVIRVTQIDKVLRTFTCEREPTSFICKLVPNNYQYPKGTIKSVLHNGIRFTVDIHDFIGHYIYFRFKNKSQSVLFSLCKPGYTIIDIGSNIGFSVLNMAKIVGADGIVIGFEPDHLNFEQLQKNISLNNFNNIKVNRIGLGDKAGRFRLANKFEANGGRKSIVPNSPNSGDATEIEVNTLDNFISAEDNWTHKIDMIKIDVEGFELNVLKGALNVIEKYSPVIFIELDDNFLRAQSASAKELIRFLSQKKYVMVNAENLKPVEEGNDFRGCHYDIICRKESLT